ncbi:MAG TPA: hypothetical protein VGP94_10405 [Tepidisphaeraceae bacterium]|nr:hypothetical protein [Tepidisphaeraceae bacterium]
MSIGHASVLGLVVGERSIIAAEVAVARDRRQVKRTAQFIFPDDLSLEKPEELGTALSQFLRQNHFSSSRAVIGVPARWVMARDKDLPPATAEVAASTLRLQAERHSSADELIFDYAGHPDPRKPRKVLLAAMLKPQMERLQRMADAAGLRLLGITSATLALAGAAANAPATSLMLTIAPDAMELAARYDGTPVLLRHLASTGTESFRNGSAQDMASMVGGEVRRVVTLMPQNGEGGDRSITLWDSVGLSESELPVLQDRSGLAVQNLADLNTLGITGATPDAARYAPAVALALSAAEKRLPLDFLHSRLATAKESRIGRRTVWAAIIGAVVIGLIAFLLVDLQQREAQLKEILAKLDNLKPDITSAEKLTEKVSYGRGWFETRPAMLACLREITLAFRDDEPIWVSSFALRDNHKGTLKGRTADRKFVTGPQGLIDRLQKNKNFSDVRVQELREVGGTSRDVSFSLNFIFNPTEQAP